RVAACALPRPSATASAKLANSTVNHSQRLTWKAQNKCGAPTARSRRNRMVVRAETISTANITGLRIISRGSSLLNAPSKAGTRMAGSVIVAMGRRLLVCESSMGCSLVSKDCAGRHRQMLDDRADRQGREEGESADDQNHADEQADE